MSSDASSLMPQSLRFFLTAPHPCSYLPEQEATTLFLDPDMPISSGIYEALTHLGFRRSGAHLYRPHCNGCQACQSVRIPIAEFAPNRTQRRTLKRNADLSVNIVPAIFSPEHYALYSRYIDARHADGDMYPPTEAQYRSFLTSNTDFSRMVEFRYDNELLAVAVVDYLEDGFSAIYTYFAPEAEYRNRSLGSFAILWQIEQARSLHLPYVYLGYWITQCTKMSYKGHYRPLEYLHGQQWLPLERG